MGKFVINGGKKLYGEVDIQSAKNVLLPLIASCILLDFEVCFNNCPKLDDVLVMLEIIRELGGNYKFVGENLYVDCSKVYVYEIPENLSKKIRASVFMIGPILARFHKACFFMSGGCNIGDRPIDIHLNGFKKLGVEISNKEVIYLKCDKLQGNEINLEYKSVGATENLIMASVLAKGKTVIKNCAKEPEIVELSKFLNGLGGKIKGAGTSVIEIEGVKKLMPYKKCFLPISDRIEAGTFMLATMSLGGEVLIKNTNFVHNISLIKKIYNNACKINLFNDRIYIKACGVGNSLGYIKTAPYPRFPTDLQSQISAYATTLNGTTIIEEGVFNARFSQLEELKKLGAKITVHNNKAIIEGVKCLYGAETSALDLRGGAAMIIAGLKAQGRTTVNNSEYLLRGYLNLDKKLQNLGADIKHVKEV